MPSPDDEPSTEPASAVSPARFAELEAAVAGLAALLRDTLTRDPQRPSGTDYEPRTSVRDAAAKSSSPTDAPPAQAPLARPPPAARDSLTWEERAPLIAPRGLVIHPAPGLSATPDFYDISADETSRILTEKRHWATLDQYRSLYRFGFYDAASHAALCDVAAAIEGAASQAISPSPEDVSVLKAVIAAFRASNQHRRDFLAYLRLKTTGDAEAGGKKLAETTRARLLKPRCADYGSPEVAALREELLQRHADYTVTAAATNKRFRGSLASLADDEFAPKPPRRPRIHTTHSKAPQPKNPRSKTGVATK
eukprot:jgi/Tetstr1/434039/TSEL_023183.t1